MRIKLSGKFLPVIVALVLLVGLVPAVAAYEAHIIDIKAHVKDYPRATRTPGFWMTHLDYTTHVFDDYLTKPVDIGWRQINSVSELMGIFWSVPGQNSDGSNRNPLCQARFKTSWHAVAAILNSALPNGANLPVSLTDIQDMLNGTDIDDINALGTILDDYNNSYDDIPIFDTYPQGSATPGLAQAIANIPFADCP